MLPAGRGVNATMTWISNGALAMNKDMIGQLFRQLLDLEEGELHPREKAVIERAAKRFAISRNVNLEFQKIATPGSAPRRPGCRNWRLVGLHYRFRRLHCRLGVAQHVAARCC
jgi:hypothetical protein